MGDLEMRLALVVFAASSAGCGSRDAQADAAPDAVVSDASVPSGFDTSWLDAAMHDAAMHDAGLDASHDAGLDASHDAGLDAHDASEADVSIDAAPSRCGDGVIDVGEACDDANELAGDGCASCVVELYSRCTGEPSFCAPIRIAYAPSDPDDVVYRAAIAAITGGDVDYVETLVRPPSRAVFASYDCVYTWSNTAYADNVALGDTLADLVDDGTSVVLGVFSTYTMGEYLAGRIMSPDYSPVVSPSGDNTYTESSYAGDGTTVVHSGVGSYGCAYRDELALQGAGVQDGSYVDGVIATAHRPDFRVVYLNGDGSLGLGCAGDWARLVANACAAAYAR